MVAASWGSSDHAVGRPAKVDSPELCPGIRRGSVYALDDAADDLSVGCEAHPIDQGSLLCVPMLALGKSVGVLHLARPAVGPELHLLLPRARLEFKAERVAAQFVTRWLLCLSAFTSPPFRAPRSGLGARQLQRPKSPPCAPLTVIGRRLRRRGSRRARACELRHAVAAKLRFRPAWDVSARQFSSFLGCNQLSLRGSHLSMKTRSSAVKK